MKQVAREVTLTRKEYREIIHALQVQVVATQDHWTEESKRLASLRSELMDQRNGGKRVIVDQWKQPID